MKVTALIPDDLLEKVKSTAGGKNITESLIIALTDYVSRQKLYDVLDEIDREPLAFREDFVAYRSANRNR